MDVDPHVLLGSSSSKVAAVVSELRHARVGALQELELASALASRVASLKALQKRLAATHGTMPVEPVGQGTASNAVALLPSMTV